MNASVSPEIELRTNRDGQMRAFIAGTRVRVQDIYAMSELQGLLPDEIVRSLPHLSLAQVHSALAYYFARRDEILREVHEDQSFVDQFKKLTGPGPCEAKRYGMEASRDSISSG